MLHDKYLLPEEEALAISSFLTPMLRLHPDKRTPASELVHHSWLDGVLVQGEIDLIRQAEEEELRRRAAQVQQQGQHQGGGGGMLRSVSSVVGTEGRMKLQLADERQQLEEMRDADALKPVEEVFHSEDGQPGASGERHGQGAAGVVTSSSAQKENQGQGQNQRNPHPHGHGHKHTGSKGTTGPPVRIDTTGLHGKKQRD